MTEHRGRVHSTEIEIDASPETVWSAVSEADQLTRWYVEDARVEPGEGGKQWIDWGGGQAMEATHLVWQPGERLVIGDPGHATATGWNAIVVEFEIEALGGDRSLLRITQSGIPEGPDWQGAYDGTYVGWQAFAETLRIYLERHPGTARRTVYDYRTLPVSAEDAWESLLLETLGMPAECFVAGAEFTAQPSDGGAPISGRIAKCARPGVLVGTIAELDDAVLFLTIHGTGSGDAYMNFVLGTYGLDDERWAAAEARWKALLAGFTPGA